MTRARRYGFTFLAGVAGLLALAPAGVASTASSANATATAAATRSAGALIPPGDTLIVVAYYDGQGNVRGQRWWGCGQPPGSWGDTTGQGRLFFTPC